MGEKTHPQLVFRTTVRDRGDLGGTDYACSRSTTSSYQRGQCDLTKAVQLVSA